MSNHLLDQRSLLRQEGSDLSDLSSSFSSPSAYRGLEYQSIDSEGRPREHTTSEYTSPGLSNNPIENHSHDGGTGLGIQERPISIPRRPVGAVAYQNTTPDTPSSPFPQSTTSRPSPNTAPGSANPLLSPAWPQTSTEYLGYTRDQGLGDEDLSRKASYADGPDVIMGDEGRGLNYDNDNMKLLDGCPAKHDIHSSRRSWLSISILILSIYSTVFSGIWLVLAMVQPRYGRIIHSGGSFTPTTASIIFALFAKTIELSFVTVFVTFLGQVLSRRSLVKTSRGVTIAELTMRTWVIQPGFMITHGQYLKHVGVTVLGGITLIAALVAMFYTTASDAIVSPHLKYGGWQKQIMSGLVKSSYANPAYITANCRTPIDLTLDPTYSGSTCLDVEHAGQAYHNSISFLETWHQIHAAGEGASSEISKRPPVPAMLFDNTTVVGNWVYTDESNMTKAYQIHNRVINNVTMSMPHAGIFAAARASENGILQPEELAGLGEYTVRAAVVSPSVNVLCVNMMKEELAPIVYASFPNAKLENSTTMPGTFVPVIGFEHDISVKEGQTYLNSTTVDDIFGWGATYARQPPVFSRFPIDFNAVTNISVPGSDSIYLLIKSGQIANYTVCQLRSFLNPDCSTLYNVSGLTGGHLEADCSAGNPMAYSKFVDKPPGGFPNSTPDWRNVGSEWMTSTSLNTGISDANASTSRLLAQFIPQIPGWGNVKLPTLMPSISETLAVMAGNTLLMSTTDATFYHFWNYTANSLAPGNWEPFNATVSSQQYTSGLQQRWQGIFYVVLLLVFATNVFCLVYFFLRSGLVTDYTEPQNLFALAVNSPPSERLSGSCGAGPEGDQLNVDWHVLADESTGHFLIKEGDKMGGYEMRSRSRTERSVGRNYKSLSSYSKLSSKSGSWL